MQEVVLGPVTEPVQRGGSFWTARSDGRQSGAALPPRAAVMRPRSGAKPSWFTPELQQTPASRRRKTPLTLLLSGRNFIRILLVVSFFAPGQKRRHRTGRMNSIKQVPTRVRSRRVEANLGAEREHFEKQQVNAEEGCWSGCLCFMRKPLLFLRLRFYGLVATSRVRACVAGTGQVPHAPFTIRKLGL